MIYYCDCEDCGKELEVEMTDEYTIPVYALTIRVVCFDCGEKRGYGDE